MQKEITKVKKRVVKKIIIWEEHSKPEEYYSVGRGESSISPKTFTPRPTKSVEVEIILLPIKVIEEDVNLNPKLNVLEEFIENISNIKVSVNTIVKILLINPPLKPDISYVNFHASIVEPDLTKVVREARAKLGTSIKILNIMPPKNNDILVSNSIKFYDKIKPTIHEVWSKDIKRVVTTSKGSESGEYVSVLDIIWTELFFEGFQPLFSRIIDGRPRIILAYKPSDNSYDYILFLSSILRDLYRIIHGGKPSMHYIAKKDELEDYSIFIKAASSITIIDIESLLNDGCTLSYMVKILKNRVKELVSQGLGFLVFYSTRENMKRIIEELSVILELDNIDVAYTGINEKKKIEAFYKFISAYYGMVEGLKGGSLSAYARNTESKYYDNLREIIRDHDILLKLKENTDNINEAQESIEHLLYKATVLKYLKNIYKGKLDQVECEKEENDIIIDILDNLGKRVIEIETLYGTRLPELKIKNTIMTRKQLIKNRDLELWIVVPNNSLLLWGSKLTKFIVSIAEKEGLQGRIKLYGVNIHDGNNPKLIEFGELIDQLRL